MDGLTHPVGDQPAAVYWKRRAFVVAGIVVVALFLWWAISSVGGGDPQTPGAGSSPDPSVSSSPDASVAADPSRACTDTDFIAAAAVPNQVSGSKKLTVTVTLTSTADSPCIVDVSKKSKLIIKSGKDTWFDSTTCEGYVTFKAEPFMLDAGAEHELKTTWNYGRDAKGCEPDKVTAKSGFYWAHATVAGVSAEKKQFQVTG